VGTREGIRTVIYNLEQRILALIEEIILRIRIKALACYSDSCKVGGSNKFNRRIQIVLLTEAEGVDPFVYISVAELLDGTVVPDDQRLVE